MIWLAAVLLSVCLSAQQVGKLCAPCHSEQLADLKTHKHFAKSVGCEICHGASQQHRNSVGATAPDQVAAPDEVAALCGQCHGAVQKLYDASKHGRLVVARSKTKAANCGTCHGVHGQRVGALMQGQCNRCHASLPEACKKKVSVAQGKLSCAVCHEPHALARR